VLALDQEVPNAKNRVTGQRHADEQQDPSGKGRAKYQAAPL
jgi:hypothetical protein